MPEGSGRHGTDRRAQRVLIIDDAEEIHDLIGVRLRGHGLELLHAHDPEAGLEMARAAAPDLILLDLDLPGKTGLEVCRELQAEPALASVPIIFLTGTVDVATKVKAFDAGAVDYVTKPFDAVELRARVGAALRTKRYLDLLATRAQLDGLTGLWNRAYFETRLGEDVAAATRYRRGLALLLVDVDHFKTINDAFGHPFGDLVLRRLAEAIAASLRPGDVPCRYGGDEFGVILREADAEAAQATAERIRAAVAALDITHAGRPVLVRACVGFATADRMADAPFSAANLLLAADHGLYAAKRKGRDRVAQGSVVPDDTIDDALAPDSASLVAEPPATLAAGTRVGPYELVEPIGRGAMATVYRAYDPRALREVAVKLLSRSAMQTPGWRRFVQEARALAALDHPSIVRVFEYGVSHDGAHYIALELLSGRTLRERLFDGPFALREALDLCLEMVRALAAAHEKGIIHRDLKPENLFLLAGGGLRILDFGLAKVISVAEHHGTLPLPTGAGVLLGTPGYLSPEQAKGQPIDARADLFSAGAILYELVTGRRAFWRSSAIETLHAVVAEEPPVTGRAEIDAVLRRCLEKEPAARVGSARELEEELLRAVARLG
jgi:diguanylate cyclase (GGDEF)-like protein